MNQMLCKVLQKGLKEIKEQFNDRNNYPSNWIINIQKAMNATWIQDFDTYYTYGYRTPYTLSKLFESTTFHPFYWILKMKELQLLINLKINKHLQIQDLDNPIKIDQSQKILRNVVQNQQLAQPFNFK
ncbi:unnamed protein product [Paramecium sonneborni]|uniref:Uncharacterized protein n=1 Tax=Paramecium sonneborni TaxID=65129 RepID=A0A8S1MM51_9CILI|nr:unnamed protein product [Paramecium sonneborni]